jgi:glycosyltransferase involved in cell wall biosynthesis
MKVCLLATSFPRFAYGDSACGNFVYELSQALAEHMQIKVIAPHAPGARIKELFGQVEVNRFVYFWPRQLQRVAYGEKGIIENLKSSPFAWIQLPLFLAMFFWKGWRITKDCDLIHAHWIITGLLAVVIKKLRHIPVVLTVHNAGLRHYPGWLRRQVLKKVDYVISPHPELTEKIRQYKKTHWAEIPNMINFNALTQRRENDHITQIKSQWGIKEEQIVTFIARLVDWKDPLTFVKALPHVIKEEDKVKFLLIGGGPLMPEIKKLVAILGIQHYIILTGPTTQVPAFLSISHIFVTLSPIENIWSTTLIEAMIAGIPCIVTRAGSTEKVLTHLRNAYLIPVKDEEALAGAIIRLLRDSTLRERLVAGAKELLETKGFSRDTIINQTLKVYRSVLEQNNQ